MRRRAAPWCIPALVLSLSVPSSGPAQAVLGPQDDALVLPRGVFRVRVLNQWLRVNQRFGTTGTLEPMGSDLTLDTVGVVQFPVMAPVQDGLRQLTGMPDLTLTLGRTILASDVRITVTPIVMELGITHRLSMGLVIPYVRTRNEILFRVNPDGLEGNVGFNPAQAAAEARAANTGVVTALNAAAGQLEASLGGATFCQADPADPRCVLIANTRQFAAGVARIYGTTSPATPGSPFIPLTGSDAQLAIQSRLRAFESLYDQPPGAFGNPFAAQAMLGVDDAQLVLTNAAFGIQLDPLETVERHGIGDIELGAKVLLFDSMRQRRQHRVRPSGLNYRFSLGALARFGTGEPDAPESIVDVGTGQGQHDLELRGFADVLVGHRIFTSVIGRYGWQFADTRELRITDDPSIGLAPVWRQQTVRRDLGDFLELEVNPRFVASDFFSVMGHYMYRSKAEDRHTGRFDIPGEVTGYGPVTLDASTLDLETAVREHRLGYGFSFSTVSAFARERARVPVEVTYFHFQTTRGAGGNVPKLYSDQVQVRVYVRLFGN